MGAFRSSFAAFAGAFVERIDKVSKADIRRVANSNFVESNRTIAMMESTKLAQAPAAAKEGK